MKLRGWKECYWSITDIESTWEMFSNPVYQKEYRKSLISLFFTMKKFNIKNWWFLCYGNVILVRFKSNSKFNEYLKFAEISVSNYQEDDTKFKSELELQTFVEIMMLCTKLVGYKLENSEIYDNFRFMERVSHCMWNQLHGPINEYLFHESLLSNPSELMKIDGSAFKKSIFEE